jgi:hypothetical protein
MKRGVAAWIRRNFEVRVSRAAAAYRHEIDGAQGPQSDTIIDAKVLDKHVEDAE